MSESASVSAHDVDTDTDTHTQEKSIRADIAGATSPCPLMLEPPFFSLQLPWGGGHRQSRGRVSGHSEQARGFWRATCGGGARQASL